MKQIISLAAIVMLIIVGRSFINEDYEIKNQFSSGESIVSFGDSLTKGIGATKGMDYPSQLSRLIDEPVHNLGVSGDTTARALKRVDQVLALNPRIVIVILGGNDLKNGVASKHAFKNLEMVINRIHSAGAMVILGGVQVPFLGGGYDDAYERIAKETGVVLIPNVLQDIFGHSELMKDRIHPNDEGYTIMTQQIHETIRPYLTY